MATKNPFSSSPFDNLLPGDTSSAPLPGQAATKPLELPQLGGQQQMDTRQPSASRSADLLPPPNLQPIFEKAARQYDVPVNVLMAIGHQESRYNAQAVGPETKWGRARGMMQYLDSTANGMGINPFDPDQSVGAAAKQIRERLDKGYSIEDAVKEHFAGPNRKLWGPKTAAYGAEVMGKVAQINELLGSQTSPDQPAQQTFDPNNPSAGLPPASEPLGPQGGLPQPEQKSELGVWDTTALLGQQLWDAAVYHLPASVAAAMEGDDPFAETDWKDSLVERGRKRSRESMTSADENTSTAIPGISSQDIKALGPSLGFSVTGMGAGIGVGLPAAAGGTFVAPGVGTVAGMAAGGAASGVAAYRMATNNFVRDLREIADLDAMQQGNPKLTDAEFAEKMAGIEDAVKEYGLWEAVPEAASNVIGFGVLKAPVKTALGKVFGKNVVTRLTTKAGSVYGTELATETVTEQGQNNVMADVGQEFGDKNTERRSWTSAEDLGESFREIAPTTILQTTILAGGTKSAMMLHDRIKRAGLTPDQYNALMELNDLVERGQFDPEGARLEAVRLLDPNTHVEQAPADQVAQESDVVMRTGEAPGISISYPQEPSRAAEDEALAKRSTATGPLSRSVENAAEGVAPQQRVTVTAPEGQISGVVDTYESDGQGGFTARVVGDDGMVYNFTHTDGVQIDLEAPKPGPLTAAVEDVAQNVGDANATPDNAAGVPLPDDGTAGDQDIAGQRPGEGAGLEAAASPVVEEQGSAEVTGATDGTGVPGSDLPTDGQPALTADTIRSELEAATQRLNQARESGSDLGQAGRDYAKTTDELRRRVIEQNERQGYVTVDPETFRDVASWVVRNKDTGEIVLETFDRKVVEALNTAKYEAVPIQEHLAGLSKPENRSGPQPGETDDNQRTDRQPDGAETVVQEAGEGQAEGSAVQPAVAQDEEQGQVTRKPIFGREIEGAQDTAVTAKGREVPVHYMVVNAPDLIASQTDEGQDNPNYPQEMQPRDRSRAASVQQINEIANTLNPRLLDRSPRASDGAPIVSPDGVVESGNGRVLAIRRAYRSNLPGSKAYRDYLSSQGYPVDGIENPVLVRVRDGDMAPEERQAFTREANERDTLSMSATERAVADAASMPDSVLDLYAGGDVDLAANRPFVRGFIDSVVGTNEQATMIASDGTMSQEAFRRVQAALLAKAYDAPDLVASLIESLDSNIRAIGGALMDVAPRWSRMKMDAKNGTIDPAMDQTERLVEAVRIVQRARREDRSVGDFVNQTDIFSGETVNPVTEGFLRLMFRNDKQWKTPAGRERIVQALTYYLDQADRAQPGVDLLGDTAPAADQVLKSAKERQYADQQEGQQQDIFAQPDGGTVASAEGAGQTGVGASQQEGQARGSQQDEGGGGQAAQTEPVTQPDSVTKQQSQLSELRARESNGEIGRVTGEPFKNADAAKKALKDLPDDGEFARDDFGVYKKEGGYVLRRWYRDGRSTGAIDAGWIDKAKAEEKRSEARAALMNERGLVEDKFGNMVTPEEAERNNAEPDEDSGIRQMTEEGRAKDGGPIMPGDVFQTSSGRQTTPYPKQKSERYASQWLIDNATAEAQSRGDEFNARIFDATTMLKRGLLTDADRDSMLMYLFGEQPRVVPPVLKPLAPQRDNASQGEQTDLAGTEKRADQEQSKPKKPTAKEKTQAERKRVEDYFTPGNIVQAYGNATDRVISFDWNDGDIKVTVQRVKREGGQWVNDGPQRTHSTYPDRQAKVIEQATPRTAPDRTSSNTIFTDEDAERARAILRAKLNQLNSGIDPEILQAGLTLAGWHIEKGARSFTAFAKAMISDMGDGVKPYLKSWYMGVRYDPRAAGFDGMSTAAEVDSADVDGVLDAEKAKSRSLVDALYEAAAAGKLPADNNALRRFVSDFDGAPADNTRLKAAQEDMEAALVMRSRDIVSDGMGNSSAREIYNRLVNLYNDQPNLNIRTSTSVENQAYSTPAPLAFVASMLSNIRQNTKVYEPTAGNGMLLIAANPDNATVNELEGARFSNLRSLGFDAVQGDALDAISSGVVAENSQDAIITNPPFGSLKDKDGRATKIEFDGYRVGKIDHLIAAEALRAMKDGGKATLIIGADKVAGGVSTDDRIFFNWLYSNYNVTSHFEVDGKLYSRQGASWPVRVININGRAASDRVSPKTGETVRAKTWEEVYDQYEQGLAAQVANDGNATSRAGGRAQQQGANDPGSARGPASRQVGETDRSGPARGTQRTGNVRRGSARDVPDRTERGAAGVAADDRDVRRDEPASQPNRLGPGEQEIRTTATQDRSGRPAGDRGDAGVGNQFQAAYVPRSSRKDEGVLIPVNMAQPTQDALSRLEDAVGDIDEFAMRELGYKTKKQLHDALMGLQVDSVASAIHQIGQGKGVVIADQTGIGKGRQAAAVIRWAARKGKIPVFVTVKPQLFTDMYGDLADIGSNDMSPLILNADEAIMTPDGKKLFTNKKSEHKRVMQEIASTGKLPDGRNALFMTYSQINKPNLQRQVVMALADKAVFVLDESHNAGGESSTGEFVQGALGVSAGVTYLSATYAKRPDNMPLYFKTDIGEAIADGGILSEAMARGGLPLQTVVSNNLVKAGQMFRRERSYDGVSIETVVDTDRTKEHEELSDNVTGALRAIVQADKAFHNGYVAWLKKQAEEKGQSINDIAGNQAAESVNHTEFSSVVHNFVRQMLLGLKADAAADHAIAAIRRGEKPLIAVENTMGSFLAEYAEQSGIRPGNALGQFDYRTVLSRALERTLFIQRQLANGEKVKEKVKLSDLDPETRAAYDAAQSQIDELKLDIPVSPIDWMRNRIEKAGYTVAEITGRNLSVDYSGRAPKLSQLSTDEQKNKVNTTRMFNDGRLDAIILNVAGSTGISLHASERFKDQKPRRMIVAQAAQDINIFMQMLGRIHRTGQVRLPSYTILNVDLPAEKRPTALLSKKMKSLNANTSSNTESATSIQAADMLNKYGDQVIGEYLLENTELAEQLGVVDMIAQEEGPQEDVARKATGRLALMPVEIQKIFYDDVESQYTTLIEFLNKTNQNDLEPRTFDFDAREQSSQVLYEGENPDSPFGQDAVYNEFSVKAQGKPMTPVEIRKEMDENLAGKTGKSHADDLILSLATGSNAFFENLTTDGQKAAAVSVRNATTGFIQSHTIGSAWRLEINGDVYNAVVTNIRSTHKGSGNPFSMSKVQVSYALNGALRSVTMPATQAKKIEVAPLYNTKIESMFSAQPKDERETAKVVTGNLLAAYGEISGSSGTIVNFTRSDGTTEQGILLPKKFNIKLSSRGDYRLKSPANALKFVRESEDQNMIRFGIANRDGTARVTPAGSGIEISVPKSKAKGGKFFLDKALTDVTGDFVSSGNLMKVKVPASKAEQALAVLINKSALYAPSSMADEARQMFGEKRDDGGREARFSVSDGIDPAVLDSLDQDDIDMLLQEYGKTPANKDEIEAAWARGDAVFIASEMDEMPFRADSREMFRSYQPEQVLTVSQENLREFLDGEGIEYSVGAGASAGLTSDQARQSITAGSTGAMIGRLIDSGAIVLHDTSATLPSNLGRGVRGVQAVTAPDGKVHVVADPLTADTAKGVTLHEMFHRGAKQLIGTEQWNKLMSRLGSIYRQSERSSGKAREFFDRARRRVDAARRQGGVASGLTNEEFGAYAIEEYERAPQGMPAVVRKWAEDMIGMVKAWTLARFGKQMGQVTPAQLSALAKLAVMDMAVETMLPPGNAAFSAAPPVDTPAFKRWFGDSKIVDADGNPMVLYHGTKSDFSVFDQGRFGTNDSGWYGRGIYLTANLGSSDAYAGWDEMDGTAPSGGNVMPLYASIKNPYFFSEKKAAATNEAESVELTENLKKQGYDGIIASNPYADGIEGTFFEVVAFYPEQVKSATGNNGNFDPENPDIRMSAVDQTETPAFRRWFKGSKAVDGSGNPLVLNHGSAGSIDTFSVPAFLTTDRGGAQWYAADRSGGEGGTITQAYAAIKKPFDLRPAEGSEAFVELARKAGVEIEGNVADGTFFAPEIADHADYEGTNFVDLIYIPAVRDALAKRGYDGLVLDDLLGSREIETWVALRPEQIKSANENNGAFDPGNPDIRYSLKPSEHFEDLTDKQKDFLNKIGREKLPVRLADQWNQWTERLGLRIRQAGVDRYATLLENDKALYGEDTLEGSIASSGWVLARMSHSAGGAMSAMLDAGRIYLDPKEKVIDVREDTTGFKAMFNRLGSPQEIDRFMAWVAANRASSLMEQGRENLFTEGEIKAGIKLAAGETADGKKRPFLYASAWKEFQQFRDDVLGIAEQAGTISPEQREMWSQEFYVPFYRVLEDETFAGPSSSSGLSRQQAYKRLKGGKENLNDLLENTLLNFHHLIQTALKNQAAQQSIENAVALGIARPVSEQAKDKKLSTFVMIGGDKQWYDIDDPMTFKALSALNSTGLNHPLMKLGRAFKRLFTNMVTATPQFVLANTLRDSLSAMATSPTSGVPLANAVKGAMIYGNSKNRASMLASGASFSFGHVYGQNPDEIKASLKGSLRKGKLLNDPALIPSALLHGWRKWNAVTDFAENINRAGIWERNLKKGKLKAAFEARDLMDFSAHGEALAVRMAIDLTPFLNARAQGVDKLYRSGVKPGAKVVAGKGAKADKKAFGRFSAVVGALSLFSAILYLLNKDDEEFRKLEDWQRDSYWFIRFGENAFFIPKPFEVGAIATLVERGIEQFADPTVAGKKFAERLGHMLTDTFALDLPQIIKPVYELSANRNTFTGRPIEDIGMQRLSPSMRVKPTTTRLAEGASRAMETIAGDMALSPVEIDHLIGAYLGQIGASAAGLTDVMWRRAMGEQLPARRWNEYQPFRRFYRDLGAPAPYTRYTTDFYNALKEADKAYANVQHLIKYQEVDRAKDMMKTESEKLGMRTALNRVQRDLSQINARMRQLQIDKTMTSEAKRTEMDRLRGIKNAITERVGKSLEQARVRAREQKESP